MPKYIVSSNDGRRWRVSLPEGGGEADAIQAIEQRLGLPPLEPLSVPSTKDLIASKPELFPVQRSGLGALKSGLSRNLSELSILGGDLLPALGASAIGEDEYARQQLLEAEQTRAAEEEVNPRQFQGFQGLNLSNAPAFLGEKLGESGADLAAIASGAGIAGILAKRAAVKKATEALVPRALARARGVGPVQEEVLQKVEKAAADRVKKSLIGTGAADLAATGTAFGVGTTLSAPRLFEGIYQQTGQLEPAAAMVGGALQGALDSVLPLSMRQIFRTSPPAFKAEVIRKLGERKELPSFVASYAGRMATGALKGAAMEGLTEGAQESIAIAAEKFVQAGEQFWSSEDFNRVFEAAATGAIVGSPFGVVSGVAENARTRGIQAKELERQQPKPITTEEPPAETTEPLAELSEASAQEPVLATPPEISPESVSVTPPEIGQEPAQTSIQEPTPVPVGLNEEVAPEVTEGMTDADRRELYRIESEPAKLMPVPEVFQRTNRVPELLTAIDEDKNAYSAIEKLSDRRTALDQLAGDIYNSKIKLSDKERLPYTEDANRDSFVSTLSDEDKDYVEEKVVSLNEREKVYEGEVGAKEAREKKRTGVVASAPFTRPETETVRGLSDEVQKTQNAYTAIENMADRTTAIKQFIADTYKGVSKTPKRPDSLPFSDLPQRQAFAKTLSPEEKRLVNVGRQKLVKAAAEKTQAAPAAAPKPAEAPAAKAKRELKELLQGVDIYSTGNPYEDLEMAKAPEAEQAAAPTATTPQEFRNVVRSYLGREPVIKGVIEVKEKPSAKSKVNERTVATANRGKGTAQFFTGRIPKGKEISAFMHEIGTHLGMEELIGKTNYQYLIGKIKSWAADTTSDKLENRIAIAAAKRVPADTPEEVKEHELIAYFVSEAIENFNINPRAISKKDTPLGLFFRYVMQGVKDILARLGVTDYQPTAQDIIEITYGAAQLVYKRADDKAAAAKASKATVETKSPLVLSMEGASPTVIDVSTPKNAKTIIDKIDEIILESGGARPALEKTLNKLTRGGNTAKELWIDTHNMFQLYETAGEVSKSLGESIRKIMLLATKRDVAITDRKKQIEDFILASRKTIAKYDAKTVDSLYNLMHESSRLEVKFDGDAPKEPEKQTLYNQFNVFRRRYPELAKMYFDLRDQYRSLYNEWKRVLEQPEILGPASKTLIEMMKGAIDPYFPLYRRGDYWVRYVDKDGEEGTQSFEEAFDRRNFIRELTAEGGKVEVEYYKPTNQQIEQLIPKEQIEKIIKVLRENKASDDVMEGVYSVYLDMFANQSVMQMLRKRKGRLGYRKDALANFADVGTRMAINTEQFKSVREISQEIELAVAKAKQDMPNDDLANAIANSLERRAKTLKNPVQSSLFDRVAGNLGHNAYRWFILGNISSAMVNLLQIPSIVLPLLSRRYGWSESFAALKDATKLYLSGGKDNNTSITVPKLGWNLSDYTFAGNKSDLSPELQRLYRNGVDGGAIRRSTGQDLMEIRNLGVIDPNNKFSYNFRMAEMFAGFLFQNGERYNREITLLAAYNLARKKGKSEADATKEAVDLVYYAHGPAMSELGPQILQNPFGRVIGTFKRFALTQAYIQYKLFRDAFFNKKIDPELRSEAIKGLLGVSLATSSIAGIKGVPFYGAFNFTASLLAGIAGDDEFDLDEIILRNFGNSALRGPLGAVLNIDVGSRAGFADLFFRTDERRLKELGLPTYAMEQLLGPAFSAGRNIYEGIIEAYEGDVQKGVEKTLPSALKNIMKAVRYATEGVTNKNGVKVIDDPSWWGITTSLIGYTPNDLSDAYARNNIMGSTQRKTLEKRASLLDAYWGAYTLGDSEGMSEIQEEIDEFNSDELGSLIPITEETKKRSVSSREKAERDAVQGMTLSDKLRSALMKKAGIENP